MGLSSVERFGSSGNTSVSSSLAGSQSTLSTSCHSGGGNSGMMSMSCQCKSENLFVAPQTSSSSQGHNKHRKIKLFKKIKLQLGLATSKNAAPCPIPNNVKPLSFHQVHGDHIRLSQERRVAKRVESFCKGITFSGRPVGVNERVFVKFSDISNNWSGVIRFGFTVIDPATLHHNLPKYACPDLTNKTGFWIKALNETYCERDNILFYYVSSSGDVHFGINGEEKGVFISGIETRSPLWTIIDVYGNCTAIEFLDYRVQATPSTAAPSLSSSSSQAAAVQVNGGNIRGSQASLASHNGGGVSIGARPSLQQQLNQYHHHQQQQQQAQCQNAIRTNQMVIAGSQRSLASNASQVTQSGILRGTTSQHQLDTDVDRIVPAFQNLYTSSATSASSQQSLAIEAAAAATTSATTMLPNIRHMPYGALSQLTPMPLHQTTKGRNVHFEHNRHVASRNDREPCQGYVFTERPLQVGETIIVQILKKNDIYNGGLALGVTSCNPALLDACVLPDDSHQLLDRPEYWVVCKDVANAPKAGDEIAICVTPSGEVTIRKNGEAPTTLMHVDLRVNLFAFLDIYGSTVSVRVLSQAPLAQTTTTTMGHSVSSQYLAEQNLGNLVVAAPQPRISMQPQMQLEVPLGGATYATGCSAVQQLTQQQQQLVQRNMTAANASNSRMAILMVNLPPDVMTAAVGQQQQNAMLSPRNHGQMPLSPGATLKDNLSAHTYPTVSECTICYENSIDSVLYTCGHMCMCYECAVQQWRGIGGGHCPLCRAVIQDVIRTYKS